MISDLHAAKGSIIIVNGNVTLGSGSRILLYDNSIIFATGTVTNNGGTLTGGQIVKPTLQNIAYVAETDDHYAYFTSDSKLYTLNGKVFVETTEAAVSKTTPATATYANVGDYAAQFDGDKAASAWSVTVTPGSDTIESLDVKVNGRGSNEGAWTDIPAITNGPVVFAVAVNLAAADVSSVTAVVNGADIAATAEVE